MPVRVDSARGVLLSAEYSACGAAAPANGCAAPQMLLRAAERPFPEACVTLHVADFDDVAAQAGGTLCGVAAEGGFALRPSFAQWEAIHAARTIELRSATRTLTIGGYGRDALSAFVAGVYAVEGRTLPSPEP